METQAKLLNHGLVPVKQRAKHKTNLERRVNTNTPHFQIAEYRQNMILECNDRFLIQLLDVDEIKYVPKGIDRTGRVEILVDVSDHFKPFPIEATLLDE